MKTDARVLIVTGGLITPEDRSLPRFAAKQVTQWRAAESAWLDLKVKLVAAEPIVVGQLARRSAGPGDAQTLAPYFDSGDNFALPTLTEVVLRTALAAEGIAAESITWSDLFAEPRRVQRILDRTDIVFASTTLLRDLSEVEPLIRRIKRPHNRIVLGGALTGTLAGRWEGMPEVDVVAVGYGEVLVPALATWIRSGCRELVAPPGGRLKRQTHSTFVHSGVPPGRDLDFLPTPDWAAAERAHSRPLPHIYYESVRGCPYRCAFCNYPYLFDDTKFRYKSADRIAEDWLAYASQGVTTITCLDSLFTMPRRRLIALCERLIAEGSPIRWVCYARTGDLTDERVVRLMKDAGCVQVQIGLESGDPGILAAMDKVCTVEDNARALDMCRTVGITSVVSVIVGYPGETQETLDRTYAHMAAHPPDFFFLATFSTRVPGVPVLSPASRARFGLRVSDSLHSVSPYWLHDTMSCTDVGNHVRALQRGLMENRVSLDAALFYDGILRYEPSHRETMLDLQMRAMTRYPRTRWVFDKLNALVDRKLRADVAQFMATTPPVDRHPTGR